jgi:hypothetical protein
VVGDEIVKSDALDEAALLASRLGCPAYQQTIAYGAHFISDHPCFMGALPRDQQQTSKILEAYGAVVRRERQYSIALVGIRSLLSIWTQIRDQFLDAD